LSRSDGGLSEKKKKIVPSGLVVELISLPSTEMNSRRIGDGFVLILFKTILQQI
jgi:hypothetical protein